MDDLVGRGPWYLLPGVPRVSRNTSAQARWRFSRCSKGTVRNGRNLPDFSGGSRNLFFHQNNPPPQLLYFETSSRGSHLSELDVVLYLNRLFSMHQNFPLRFHVQRSWSHCTKASNRQQARVTKRKCNWCTYPSYTSVLLKEEWGKTPERFSGQCTETIMSAPRVHHSYPFTWPRFGPTTNGWGQMSSHVLMTQDAKSLQGQQALRGPKLRTPCCHEPRGWDCGYSTFTFLHNN